MINKKKRFLFKFSFLAIVVSNFFPLKFLININNKKIKLKKKDNLVWYLDSNDL